MIMLIGAVGLDAGADEDAERFGGGGGVEAREKCRSQEVEDDFFHF